MATNNLENTKLVKKLFEYHNLNNSGKIEKFKEVFSSDAKINDPSLPNKKTTLQAFLTAENEYIKAFPDKHTNIDDIFTADNKVVVRWTSEGTCKGLLHGVSPTNKHFKVSGITIYRVENNKIVEVWQNYDQYGLLDQIGELRALHPAH